MQELAPVDKEKRISPLQPILPTHPGEVLYWSRLYGSSRGLAIARAAAQRQSPLLVIAADARSVRRLEDEIRFYASPDPQISVMAFPDWECLPYDALSPHPDIVSQRLLTLSQLPGLRAGVVLTSVATLMHPLPPLRYVAGHTLQLRTGDHLRIEDLRTQLVRAGYHNVSQVMEPGEFAVRGGLMDLFPMGSVAPYRIDLFGDEIESDDLPALETETEEADASEDVAEEASEDSAPKMKFREDMLLRVMNAAGIDAGHRDAANQRVIVSTVSTKGVIVVAHRGAEAGRDRLDRAECVSDR